MLAFSCWNFLILTSMIMSWNRFDSHNFMTTAWFIRFSMVNHSLSIVYGLKFNLSITHIPIKMVWTEASHPTDQPTDRPSDWSSKWMIFVLKRFLIVFVQWPCQIENIYIWSLRIWCKLKPTKKKYQRWYIIAVSVIHPMESKLKYLFLQWSNEREPLRKTQNKNKNKKNEKKDRPIARFFLFFHYRFCNWKVFIWFIKHWMFLNDGKWPWPMLSTNRRHFILCWNEQFQAKIQ